MDRGQVKLKKTVSKADERARLQQEMEGFLKRGGGVGRIATGVSGKDPADPPLYLNRRLFVEPPLPRTPIPEVVAAIEARRALKPRRGAVRNKSRLPKPRRKIIYDDFGEPLRKVWIDED